MPLVYASATAAPPSALLTRAFSPSAPQRVERPEVSAILLRGPRILVRLAFVEPQRGEGDDPRPYSLELGDVVSEGAARPLAAPLQKRREDDALVVAREERDLQPNLPPFEHRVAVLVLLRDVRPAAPFEQGRHPTESRSLRQTAMSRSSCARVTRPAWKSTAQPPKTQYSMPWLSSSSWIRRSARSWSRSRTT
jgi:hypothetical protein